MIFKKVDPSLPGEVIATHIVPLFPPRRVCEHGRPDHERPTYCYYEYCPASYNMSGPVVIPAKAPPGLAAPVKEELCPRGHRLEGEEYCQDKDCSFNVWHFLVKQKKSQAPYMTPTAVKKAKSPAKTSAVLPLPRPAPAAKEPGASSLPPCPVLPPSPQQPLYNKEIKAAKDKLTSLSHRVYSIEKSSMEQEAKQKNLTKMAIPVMKLWVQVDNMQKAKKTQEKMEELRWLYGKTDGLLKTIHHLISGKERAARRSRRARQGLASSTLAVSEAEKAKTTVQPILR